MKKVAIKVQHRGLRETCVGDIEACALAVRVVARIFPAFKLEWLVDEIAPHLPVELNFVNEAKNCRRAASIFADRQDVAVPEVVRASPRVLVMSFEEGVNGTRRADIAAPRRSCASTPTSLPSSAATAPSTTTGSWASGRCAAPTCRRRREIERQRETSSC